MPSESTLLLGQSDVRKLLPMGECVEVMTAALRALSRRDVVQPVRSVLPLPDGSGVLGVMPGFLGTERVVGLKAITVMPGNHGTAFDSHQGVVLLFEATHGRLRAIVDATAITAIRTAAVSAVATRALADPAADELAILGSGVQAEAHVDALLVVQPIRRIRIWSRNLDNARRLAAKASARTGLPVEAVEAASDAVHGAGIICTTTSSREPVLRGAWVASGAHVNAVGACVPTSRELDSDAVRRASVFVDHRPAALAEAGDLLIPIREGSIAESHILAEIGDVLTGAALGRRSPKEVTVFKSLGLAVEDLAAASQVYANALASGAGMPVALGGYRFAPA